MAPAKKAAALRATKAKMALPRPDPRLEKAFKKAAKLSPKAQKALAAVVVDAIETLEDELMWDATFARTQDQLALWVNDVRKEIETGEADLRDLDELLAK